MERSSWKKTSTLRNVSLFSLRCDRNIWRSDQMFCKLSITGVVLFEFSMAL